MQLADHTTDLMQGWGSLIGATVAVPALVFTGLLLLHEIRTRREEMNDSAQAQARLVVGRVLGVSRALTNKETGHMEGPIVSLHWEVNNYSGAPIFDVSAAITYPPDGATYVTEDPIEIVVGRQAIHIDVNPPLDLPPGQMRASDAPVRIRFTDASGRIWHRTDRRPPARIIERQKP